MQKETAIQGPKEHMLLTLPFGPTLYTWKSWNSSPCRVGCTHGCRANLLPVFRQ